MEIQLSIPDTQKALSLIAFIRSFSPNIPIQILPEKGAETPAVSVDDTSEKQANPSSFYQRFKGSLPNVDVADFERYLAETRNEWERDTF